MWICMRSLEISKFVYNAGFIKNNCEFKKLMKAWHLASRFDYSMLLYETYSKFYEKYKG